jgi:hypothetical protein
MFCLCHSFTGKRRNGNKQYVHSRGVWNKRVKLEGGKQIRGHEENSLQTDTGERKTTKETMKQPSKTHTGKKGVERDSGRRECKLFTHKPAPHTHKNEKYVKVLFGLKFSGKCVLSVSYIRVSGPVRSLLFPFL